MKKQTRLRKITKRGRAVHSCIQNLGFGIGALLITPMAIAAKVTDAGSVANNIKETGTSFLDMIYVLMAIVGFIMFVANGVKLLSEKKQQQDSDIGTWKMFAAGIFLMTPMIFLSAFVSSVTGETTEVNTIESSMGLTGT